MLTSVCQKQGNGALGDQAAAVVICPWSVMMCLQGNYHSPNARVYSRPVPTLCRHETLLVLGEACGPQGRPLLFFRAVSRIARKYEHMSYPTICLLTDVKVGMGAGSHPSSSWASSFYGLSLVLQ